MTAPLPAWECDASAATAVSVPGARLRLRAMVAIGHSPARITRALGEGISTRTVQRILCGAPTDLPQRQLDRIHDLYEQWWDLLPAHPHQGRADRRQRGPAPRPGRLLVHRHGPGRRPPGRTGL